MEAKIKVRKAITDKNIRRCNVHFEEKCFEQDLRMILANLVQGF